jgi:hypothetical protein
MVTYITTDKGYYYKQFKNGKKIRVSYNEYKAKSLKTSGGSNTTSNILPEDVLYQDDLVCILKPNSRKGVMVYTLYNQPKNSNSLCNLGLKTGKKLKDEGFSFVDGTTIHPHIFFRAPFYSPDKKDYSSIEAEATALYGKGALQMSNRVWIRVDPDRTYVFSSEIRAKAPLVKHDDKFIHNELQKSKKTITDYLVIIASNQRQVLTPPFNKFKYHLHKSTKVPFIEINGGSTNGKIDWSSPSIDSINIPNLTKIAFAAPSVEYPFDTEPIEKNSEILVSMDHLPSEYFVHCT